MSQSGNLTVLVRPCDSGMCPALYTDDSGKLFIQGIKLSASGRRSISVAAHEEVVEITPEILGYLKSN